MLRRISDCGVLVGGGLMILCAVLVTVDVFLRKIAGVALPGADELSSYAFAAATAWAFSQVLFDRANVRVDLILSVLPRPLAAMLDVIAILALGAFSLFLLERTAGVLMETYDHNGRSNTPLQTPLIIPQFIWFAGIAFMCVNVLWLALRSVARFIKGDWQGVAHEIGTPESELQLYAEDDRSGAAHKSMGRES